MNSSKENYLYCTAIIQTTKKIPYEDFVVKLSKLKKETNKEPGCIFFEIVPLDRVKERFALWEIWKDTCSFYAHHEKEYTKIFFLEELDTLEVFESSEKVSI